MTGSNATPVRPPQTACLPSGSSEAYYDIVSSTVFMIMLFADTLALLADKQSAGPDSSGGVIFLDVYKCHRFLRILPIRRYFARLYLRIVNDEWRVMLQDPRTPDGPFFGADYSTTEGEDAESALLGVWKRESKEWRRCESIDIEAIGCRIACAVELARLQVSMIRIVRGGKHDK